MSSADVEQRIERGREAIALAKEKGLDTSLWEKALAELEQALELAQEVASQTQELLATRGWCLWKCSVLGDEVIAVARDEEVKEIPGGYPVYLEYEMEQLCQVEDSTLRLIHEAKKLAGATIIGTERQSINSTSPVIEALGMSIEEALHIWTKEGKPVIHLGPGENCFDLERLLSHRDVNNRHLVAIRERLLKKSESTGSSQEA